MLTQYKSHSLDRHITTTWRMCQLLGNYVTPVPAQQRLGPRWYTGSADAICQTLNLVYDEKPDYLVVFGADHVYRMDPSQMVDRPHRDRRGGRPSPASGCRARRPPRSASSRPTRTAARSPQFLEKPADPPAVPDDPDGRYASMGNYVFTTEALIEALRIDAADEIVRARHGRQHHPVLRDRRGAGARLRLRPQRGARRDRARPRLLAGRRDPGRVPRRAHGPGVACTRSSTSTTGSGRSSASRRPLPPAKFVEGGTAHESMVGSRHDHLRRARPRSVVVRRRADRHRAPSRGLGDPAGRADRPRRGGPAHASWTRT